MALEIEYKFLVDKMEWEKLEKPEPSLIIQSYLINSEQMTVRIRIKGDKGYLTIKGKTVGVTREEFEYEIPIENAENINDWTKVLQNWSENYLAKGKDNLLEEAIPDFERTIIKVPLSKTMGRKREAAELLGWGRNTLTRKIKELGLDN